MTAVMRAVAATGPKVLRIGVVQAGRVSEERIIKQRTHVTVGPSEKNMFVIATSSVPATFRVFELVGNDYHLNFLDGMTGRIALPTGISDLSLLKGQARRTSQGAYQIRLTEDSRGKVVIGETTFLFQFVAPPPIQPKPQLPVAGLARRKFDRLEHDDHLGRVVPLSFSLARLDLLGLARSDRRRRSERRRRDRLAEEFAAAAPVEDKPEEKPDESAKADKTPDKAPAPAPPPPRGRKRPPVR